MTEPTTSQETKPSPLAEADPNSLQKFFNANPATLTDDEFRQVIQHYRNKRHLFMEAQKDEDKKAKAGPKVKLPTVNIDDIEF